MKTNARQETGSALPFEEDGGGMSRRQGKGGVELLVVALISALVGFLAWPLLPAAFPPPPTAVTVQHSSEVPVTLQETASLAPE